MRFCEADRMVSLEMQQTPAVLLISGAAFEADRMVSLEIQQTPAVLLISGAAFEADRMVSPEMQRHLSVLLISGANPARQTACQSGDAADTCDAADLRSSLRSRPHGQPGDAADTFRCC